MPCRPVVCERVLGITPARVTQLVQCRDAVSVPEVADRGSYCCDGPGDVVPAVRTVGDCVEDAGGELPVFGVAGGGVHAN